VAGNGTERYEHGWKRNGLRHGTGTVLFHARVLTVSCPAFRKFGTARHDTVKALDTVRVPGTARNGTGGTARHGTGHSSNDTGRHVKQRVDTDRHGASGALRGMARLAHLQKTADFDICLPKLHTEIFIPPKITPRIVYFTI
jgi:hypothetical protein